jgi:GNAT superfamily N-acetyltransferase
LLTVSGDDQGDDNKFLGSFTIAFSDPLIWGEHDLRTYAKTNEKNQPPRALYLHRIATMPAVQGQNLFAELLQWAENYASKCHPPIDRLRMDTVGDNPRLTAYYVKHGFHFLGLTKLTETTGLHDNYSKDVISLYERVLTK